MKLELINKLTAQKMNHIISDIEAMLEGYTIVYVIDTYDIVEYCFPLGIESDDKTNKNIDQIGDEQIAYEFLFNRFNRAKAMLFEEYKIEILHFRSKLLRIKEAIENQKSDIREKFIDPIIEETDAAKRKELLEELENRLSFLLSFALMPDESMERFSATVNNRFLLDPSELNHPELQDIIAGAAEEAASIEKKVFEKWVEENKGELAGISRRTELINKMNAAFRDVRVMLKTLFINRALLAQGSTNKFIFLLHSSTPERSESIVKMDVIQNLMPHWKNEKYSVWRDKSQMFLLSLLWPEENDKTATIDSLLAKLEKFRDAIKELEKISGGQLDSHARQRAALQDFESMLQQALNRFENNQLLAKVTNYMKYRDSVRKQISDFMANHARNMQPVIGMYKRILEEAQDHMKKLRPELVFQNVKLAYTLQVSISAVFRRLADSKKMIVSKGRDLVRGSFHHLPFLLFLPEKNIDTNAKKVLDPLLQFCFKPEQARLLATEDFLAVLRYYQEFDARYVNETPSITLVSLFLILLLPVADDRNGGFETVSQHENEVLKHAKDLVPIYENLNVVSPGSIDYYRELLYMTVWLCRRCLLLEQSMELASEGIRRYPDDPRFYHGMGLTLYSKNLRESTQRQFKSAEQIKEIIELIQRARQLYARQEINRKIELTTIALNNTLCHLMSELFRFTGEESALREGRNYLQEIKKYLGEKSAYAYSDYPEFLHTEAALELQEGRYFESLTDFQNAFDKLEFAGGAIKKALKMVPDSELYKNIDSNIRSMLKGVKKALVKNARKSAGPGD